MQHDTRDTLYNHDQISMVVADGLAPIWHHGICNHRHGVARVVYITIAQRYGILQWGPVYSV